MPANMGDWMDEKNKLNVFSAAGSLRDAALFQVQARKEKQEADQLAHQLAQLNEAIAARKAQEPQA